MLILDMVGPLKVFEPLLTDLKSLHAEGVDLGPQYGVRKGTVVQVLGDNLGSHMLGGFVENFSGTYFCRFCLATRDSLKTGLCHPCEFAKRTPDNYDGTVFELEQFNCENLRGIKLNSVLNELPDFHVCAPSMPPCIGHDFLRVLFPVIYRCLFAIL